MLREGDLLHPCAWYCNEPECSMHHLFAQFLTKSIRYCRGLGFLMSFLGFLGDFSADLGGGRPRGPRKSSPPCDFTSIGGRRAPEDDI